MDGSYLNMDSLHHILYPGASGASWQPSDEDAASVSTAAFSSKYFA